MGKEWAGLFFPWGKNGPAHSFPREKNDWGEIPACYTGISPWFQFNKPKLSVNFPISQHEIFGTYHIWAKAFNKR